MMQGPISVALCWFDSGRLAVLAANGGCWPDGMVSLVLTLNAL
jgi:hypothetical protein